MAALEAIQQEQSALLFAGHGPLDAVNHKGGREAEPRRASIKDPESCAARCTGRASLRPSKQGHGGLPRTAQLDRRWSLLGAGQDPGPL